MKKLLAMLLAVMIVLALPAFAEQETLTEEIERLRTENAELLAALEQLDTMAEYIAELELENAQLQVNAFEVYADFVLRLAAKDEKIAVMRERIASLEAMLTELQPGWKPEALPHDHTGEWLGEYEGVQLMLMLHEDGTGEISAMGESASVSWRCTGYEFIMSNPQVDGATAGVCDGVTIDLTEDDGPVFTRK